LLATVYTNYFFFFLFFQLISPIKKDKIEEF
jgi:hypothetical protein